MKSKKPYYIKEPFGVPYELTPTNKFRKLGRHKRKEKICEGDSFPKNRPMYMIQPEDIVKKEGSYRVGTIPVGKKKMYAIEDQLTITRYKSKKCALEHLKDSLRIDKAMRESR